ncbi:protein jagunal-like [Amphibalanus amphitrite]|uniref:protein jagunal-like n=1 Tax=Amphibalanus amphitrite TaxID=1232801 RepID=UPI001C91FAFD|nr:protein jagunal-like [Amphibalanus amphitrite]
MASMNGPTVMGTDGRDFLHRERVASQYKVSAQTKTRLKCCLFFHLLLAIVMLLKLLPDILDKLNIFILEVEELEMPQPVKWEYLWTFSILYSIFALSACRKNSSFLLQVYIGGVVALGLAPVVFAFFFYLPEAYEFVSTGSAEGQRVWQGFPYSMVNMAFLLVALQVHIFSLFFSSRLLTAWKVRGTKKAQ